MANLSKTTRDHEEIRTWAEERGGKPAHVKATGSEGDIGILRIDFPGYTGQGTLEPITWEQFFDKFDERGLSFLYQEETAAGERSNFNKLVSAETAAESESRSRSRGKRASSKKSASKKAASTRRSSGTAKKASKAASKKSSGRKTAKKTGAKKSSSQRSGLKKATRKKTTAKKGSSSSRRRSR